MRKNNILAVETVYDICVVDILPEKSSHDNTTSDYSDPHGKKNSTLLQIIKFM